MSAITVRSEPCSACPYRCDVPSGLWAAHEYDKLRDYDAPTGNQPIAPFMCHATPGHYCHGWAVTHSFRGHDHELLALRFRGVSPDELPEADVPLFESGNDAADHGQADLDDPSPETRTTAARLMRKYPRLRGDERETVS